MLSSSPAPFTGKEPGVIPTESSVWGVTKWGEAKWTVPGALLDKMLAALNARNKRKKNNIQDVLIAETALLNLLAMVTADADLAEVMNMFGGTVVTPERYKERNN